MSFSRLILILAALAPAGAFAAPVGFVTNVRGAVELSGKPVLRSTPVSVGDVVETKAGKATILIGKNQVIHLDLNTRIEITQALVDQAASEGAETTDLRMPYGRVRAMVRSGGAPKTFRIRSRSAVMGVRGTHIYMDTPKDARLPQTFAAFDGVATVEYSRVPVGGGAAPGPDTKSFTLRKDESIQAGGDAKPGQVAKLPPGKAAELMRQVAPPPKEARSPDEMRRNLERKKNRPGPKGGAGGDPLDGGGAGDFIQGQLPGGAVPLDPNLPVGANITVKVRGIKK